MRTEAARTALNGELVAQLASGGDRLAEPVARAIRSLGRRVVPVQYAARAGTTQRAPPVGSATSPR